MFCEATSFRQPITAWRLHGQILGGIFRRVPEYRDMESRIMCLATLEGDKMNYDLEEMIEIFGEKAVHEALQLYGAKYGFYL